MGRQDKQKSSRSTNDSSSRSRFNRLTTTFLLFASTFLLLPLSCFSQQCVLPLKPTPPRGSDPRHHPTLYKVGVFGIRGAEQAFQDYNATFRDYLTEFAGQQFDPPLQFEIVPIFNNKDGFLDYLASGEVDFMFMHTGAYSCVESEVGARGLATVVSRRSVVNSLTGQLDSFELTSYGGVIFARADNDDIQTIQDIRDTRTAAVSVVAFGAGQLQFRELTNAGIHHMQDVAQLVLMEKQPNVVNAVLQGKVDVGYVRTDQLERTIDELTGQLVDLSKLKVIQSKQGLMDNGRPFPFPSSSRLYPEWSFSAFGHVHNAVVQAVQEEILQMPKHAAIGPALFECFETNNCGSIVSQQDGGSTIPSETSFTTCHQSCMEAIDPAFIQQCDSTLLKAVAAYQAMLTGNVAGWTPSASYMEVRNMQDELGFIQRQKVSDTSVDEGVMCIRSSRLRDAITCPPDHFKKSEIEIGTGCVDLGLDCYGFQCICKPCVMAFDVDFFPLADDLAASSGAGCGKFEACGQVDQGDSIIFHAIDNRQRSNVSMSVTVFNGAREEHYTMDPSPSGSPYEFEASIEASRIQTGEHIMLVLVDGEQIPESPFRLIIGERDCATETGDPLSIATAFGDCVCESNSVDIFDRCVSNAILLPIVICLTLLLLITAVLVYVEQKRKASDTIWQVDPSELIFTDPPRALGRGTFGLVLLAEFRGTQVAVKRVLPPKLNDATRKNEQFDFQDSTSHHASLGSKSIAQVIFGASHSKANGAESGITSHVASTTGTQDRKAAPLSASNTWFSTFGQSSYKKLEREFIQEMRLLSTLRHPCITTTMGAVLSRNTEPMMVMEHMELGSLYDLLHNDSMVLDGEILLPILRDIARGLRFLHAATPQIVHADLKAANVLVDGRFHAKVADFGLSRKRLFRHQAAGTPFWMAPELLVGETTNTTMSDVYALGVVLFEVISRKDPYEGERSREILELVVDKNVNKRPGIPEGISAESQALMESCLQADAEARPTAEDISIRLEMFDFDDIFTAEHEEKRSKKKQRDCSAEGLLTQLFPKHVADALREGRKVEPEQHDSVTVYFSDIVDYTTISTELSATKVSSLLDRLYTKFDKLCDVHDVFKVETVGDAYMTVTNIAKKDLNHCERMAAFALDAMHEAQHTLVDEEEPSKGFLQIRSGINTGPVVAHVVGTRNPRYSIIGDTVNTAARMESNSKPGKIQCSEESAMILRQTACHKFDVRLRGTYPIKGKGEMVLYWIDAGGKESFGGTVELEGGGDKKVLPAVSSKAAERHKPNLGKAFPLEPITEASAECAITTLNESSQFSKKKREQNWASSQSVWMSGTDSDKSNV